MKSVQFESPGHVALIDHSTRQPDDHEVTVAIDRVGICATDLHIFHGSFPTATYPITPGHEATGIVTAVGGSVADLTVGARVVLDPGMPCRRCTFCRRGRFNLCANRRAFGVTDDGAATEELLVPAEQLFVVDPTTPAGAAVLAEPLACVVHAFDLVASPAGASVLIYGAGTVGLLASIVARSLGAAYVAVVDVNDHRLQSARALGADATATASATLEIDRFDLVVDATGAIPAIADGIPRVDRGGSFLQIGVAHPDATISLSPYEIFARELTIAGSLTTRHSFPRAIAMLNAGAIDHSLFTAEPMSLDEYVEAIAAAERGETPKVTVAP